MSKPERPPTLVQSVASHLREKILKREIVGGEPLRQEAISNALGTSIIPVREALRQLEAEGLVELHARRGAVVTTLSLEQALEWIHMRCLIETDLIGKAMDNMAEGHIVRAEKILEEFDGDLDVRRNIHRWSDHNHRWSDHNWKFHSALYEAAGRPETLHVLGMLHSKCDRYIRVQLMLGDHIARAEREHAELIQLCRKGKKRAVKALMRRHIIGVEEDLVELLRI